MSKPIVAIFSIVAVGVLLLCGGIFILAGVGWAMIAAAIPFLLAALVLIRGLSRV